MRPDILIEIISKTYEPAIILKKKFEKLEDEKWQVSTFVQELTLQVSHLHSVFITEELSFILEEDRNISNIRDEMADVYLQIINLSNKFFEKSDLKTEIRNQFERVNKELIKIKSTTHFLTILSILLGQISESTMILTKYRFKLNRHKIYKNEEHYLKIKISEFIIVLAMLSNIHNTDLNQCFNEMVQDAEGFLEDDHEN